MSSEEQVLNLAQQWLAWDANQRTKADVQRWVDGRDIAHLTKALTPRIAFGTAGTL